MTAMPSSPTSTGSSSEPLIPRPVAWSRMQHADADRADGDGLQHLERPDASAAGAQAATRRRLQAGRERRLGERQEPPQDEVGEDPGAVEERRHHEGRPDDQHRSREVVGETGATPPTSRRSAGRLARRYVVAAGRLTHRSSHARTCVRQQGRPLPHPEWRLRQNQGRTRWWFARVAPDDGCMEDTKNQPNEASSSEQSTTDDDFDPRRLRTIADMRRSKDDRMLAGVCAGAAKYLNVDPVVIRVVIAVLTFVGLSGLILYVAAWFLLPAEGEQSIAADWFNLDKNEEQVRIIGLVGAAVLAALAIVGDSQWAWWGLPWVLVPLAVLYWFFVVRPRRHEPDDSVRTPT